jgi:hypothetical protein
MTRAKTDRHIPTVKRRNRKVTHCPAGHEYAGENLYVYVTKDGHTERKCKACHRERMRKRQGYQGKTGEGE